MHLITSQQKNKKKKTHFTFSLKSHSLLCSCLSSYNPFRTSVCRYTTSLDLLPSPHYLAKPRWFVLILNIDGTYYCHPQPSYFFLILFVSLVLWCSKIWFSITNISFASNKVKSIVHSTSKLVVTICLFMLNFFLIFGYMSNWLKN